MFHVRNMTPEDFEFAVRVTDTMNWELVEEDFEFMLRLEPQGCFVLLDGLVRVGVVTTVSFGEMGWLGNLVVAETHRKRGGGSLLAKHAVNYLKSKNVETIGLYSYTNMISFYSRLGFRYDSEFTVLKGRGFSSAPAADLKEARKEDVQDIINCDRFCFGASRQKLLKSILFNPHNSCYLAVVDGQMLGYAVAKAFDDTGEIGPLVCRKQRSDIAIDLLKANLNRLEGFEVSACVPREESVILKMLMKSGFREDFRVARMFFKPRKVKDCIYVAESLERG